MGDLNSLLYANGKKSRAKTKIGMFKEFLDWFARENMLDLGFKGLSSPGRKATCLNALTEQSIMIFGWLLF